MILDHLLPFIDKAEDGELEGEVEHSNWYRFLDGEFREFAGLTSFK